MPSLRWYDFRQKHACCHVVIAFIPDHDPLAPEARAGHALLLRQIRQLEIAGDYAVTVMREAHRCEIHCAFESEIDAAAFAESVAANAVERSTDYATAWEFQLDTATVWTPGRVLPSQVKGNRQRRTSARRIGWGSFRQSHPMAHLVSSAVVPSLTAPDLARLRNSLSELIERQAQSKFAVSIVRGEAGIEIRCGFADKADADHLAEVMKAETAGGREGWLTHRSFQLEGARELILGPTDRHDSSNRN